MPTCTKFYNITSFVASLYPQKLLWTCKLLPVCKAIKSSSLNLTLAELICTHCACSNFTDQHKANPYALYNTFAHQTDPLKPVKNPFVSQFFRKHNIHFIHTTHMSLTRHKLISKFNISANVYLSEIFTFFPLNGRVVTSLDSHTTLLTLE